jgi:hypothetical protein
MNSHGCESIDETLRREFTPGLLAWTRLRTAVTDFIEQAGLELPVLRAIASWISWSPDRHEASMTSPPPASPKRRPSKRE